MSRVDYFCEAWIEGAWKTVSIQTARDYPELARRCSECHGQIKIMRAGHGGAPRSHPEHYERHKGCSLGNCFDGERRPHPKQVGTPTGPGPVVPHIPEEILAPNLYVEGATTSVRVNVYERDPKARKTCLKHFGYKCAVCEFDFEARYGAAGKGIIHVHHVVPLSQIKNEYKVDPIQDLRPVCPNCHAIIHKKSPAYSLEEVVVMLRASET